MSALRFLFDRLSGFRTANSGRSNLCPGLLAVLVIWAGGCGPGGTPTGLVSGKVTMETKPVANAYIAFSSSVNGKAAGANLNAAGEYRLTDALPVGDYVVTITPPSAPPPLSSPSTAPVKIDIPDRYRSEAKTDLKFPIKAGSNKADFELKR